MPDKNLADWDIPVTEDFVDRVRRGVRRRRNLRALTTGAAAVLVAVVVSTVTVVASRPGHRVVTPPQVAPSAEVMVGWRLTHLPPGAERVRPDSTYPAAVTADGLGGSAPAPGEPGVSVTVRRFDRGTGIGMFVTVLRPTPPADGSPTAAQIAGWLAAWAARGTTLVRTFDTPAGPARLVAHAGTEVTAYEVIVTTRGQDVITVGGNAAFTAEELTETALGLA